VALRLLEHVRDKLGRQAAPLEKLIVWAAQLHEIGLAVSHTGFHKHGAYLLQHSYLPGFSADDQRMLAAIVRAQRRKIARASFAELPAQAAEAVSRACLLFRLAVLLNRSRSPQIVPAIEVDDAWQTLLLRFPAGWSEAHPLTRADLEQEAGYLRATGVELRVAELERGPAPKTRGSGRARAGVGR